MPMPSENLIHFYFGQRRALLLTDLQSRKQFQMPFRVFFADRRLHMMVAEMQVGKEHLSDSFLPAPSPCKLQGNHMTPFFYRLLHLGANFIEP